MALTFKLKNCQFILLPSLNEAPIFYIKLQNELNTHKQFLKLSREGTSEIRVTARGQRGRGEKTHHLTGNLLTFQLLKNVFHRLD